MYAGHWTFRLCEFEIAPGARPAPGVPNHPARIRADFERRQREAQGWERRRPDTRWSRRSTCGLPREGPGRRWSLPSGVFAACLLAEPSGNVMATAVLDALNLRTAQVSLRRYSTGGSAQPNLPVM